MHVCRIRGWIMKAKRRLEPELQLICDFMHYAFLPKRELAQRVASMYRDMLTDPAIETFDRHDFGSARRLSARILQEKFEELGVTKIKLGVTAGMDSRGLLGAILDVLPADRIIAYTKGQVGNKDYERARFYTENILPHHYVIATQDGTYSIDDWTKRLRARPEGTTGNLYGISREVENPMKEHGWMRSVSGFLGDACSGKRLHGKVHMTWNEAVAAFVHKNEVFRPSSKRVIRSMLPSEYDPLHVMPRRPLLPQDLMTYDDQLDFCFRQYQRIGLNFLPDEKTFTTASDGQTQRNRHQITVYDDPRWQKSYLSMPSEERIDAKHYRAMLAANYPDIFLDLVNPEDPRFRSEEKPTTGKERLEFAAKTGLHTNWELLWNENDNFRSFALTLIRSLAERDILYWLDPLGLVEEFEKDILGLGKILWCLCSVELNIRAGKLPVPSI